MQNKEHIELLQLQLDIELLFQQMLTLKLYRLALANLSLADRSEDRATSTIIERSGDL